MVAGEYQFLESAARDKEHAIGRMQYHAENPEFPQNDKRRYGPFMADNLIIAHKAEPGE
jgi:hypothetical protein